MELPKKVGLHGRFRCLPEIFTYDFGQGSCLIMIEAPIHTRPIYYRIGENMETILDIVVGRIHNLGHRKEYLLVKICDSHSTIVGVFRTEYAVRKFYKYFVTKTVHMA